MCSMNTSFYTKCSSEFYIHSNIGAYTEMEVDEILGEALKLKSFVHQNVLNLIGVSFESSETPYIITPYMVNGSLLSYLRKERKSLVLPKETDEDIVSADGYYYT